VVFPAYADHPRPYLVGMAVALAAAGSIHCELRWPNDLILGARKVGGILTELITDPQGRSVPIVGVGVNLNQKTFPEEIAPIATSKALYDGGMYDPEHVARTIVDRLALLPEPSNWSDLAPVWSLFDNTPGKIYKLPDGKEATALGVGPQGELLCAVNGESTTVLAADALFGH
jgi:BirA family transcriptional regulator, biotin operon repressor / biotin---[acetyl-CoA-carboxylase] ligase